MAPDQGRFHTMLPEQNTTQPALEVQLQPNGDFLHTAVVLLCRQF